MLHENLAEMEIIGNKFFELTVLVFPYPMTINVFFNVYFPDIYDQYSPAQTISGPENKIKYI